MKRHLVPLLAALGAAMAPSSAAPADTTSFVEDTRTYLGRLEKLGFAGTVLVAERGEILLAEGYGWANRQTRTRWTPETVSTVGSITKQFTAAAILALEEDGKLRVKDPITKFFPGVPEEKTGITLHHLLTHTSGILDAFPYDDFDAVGRDLILKLAMEFPVVAPPGAHYEYANINYSILGLVVERASGMPYESYLRERLFAPAGMTETGYRVAWDPARIAQGYRGRTRWGTILERPWAEDGPYWMLRANGGIHSTSRDMLRWVEALLDDKVLTRASREKMWTGYADEGEGESFYGYGWVVMTGPGGKRVITHNGGNGIFFTDLGIEPESGTVIFLMTNVVADFPRANGLLREIGGRFMAGAPYPPVPEVIEVGIDRLVGYAGNYVLPSGGRVEVRASEGRLDFLPKGADAWRALYQPTAPESLLAVRQGVIAGVVNGFLAGDYRPMYEAYEHRVALETLAERGRGVLAELAAEIGDPRGCEVLGSGPLEEGMATFVRIFGDRGAIYRQYIWTPEGSVLGHRQVPDLQIPGYFPVAEDRFQAFGGRLDVTTPARFERGPDRRWELVLGDGAEAPRLPWTSPR